MRQSPASRRSKQTRSVASERPVSSYPLRKPSVRNRPRLARSLDDQRHPANGRFIRNPTLPGKLANDGFVPDLVDRQLFIRSELTAGFDHLVRELELQKLRRSLPCDHRAALEPLPSLFIQQRQRSLDKRYDTGNFFFSVRRNRGKRGEEASAGANRRRNRRRLWHLPGRRLLKGA